MAEHYDPILGERHNGLPENCEDLACREKWKRDRLMALEMGGNMGSKMHGMRGRVADPEEQLRNQRGQEKTELAQMAIEEYNLSFVVKKFSSHDRWPLKFYDATIADNGVLAITDKDSGILIFAYAAPGIDWHTLGLEYQPHIKDSDHPAWFVFNLEKAHAEFMGRKDV